MKSRPKIYESRLNTLKKRRDYLDRRIANADKELSYDKAEVSALDWALKIVESDYEKALDMIEDKHEED